MASILERIYAGHDVIGTGPEEVTRTKSLGRTANLLSAEDVLALKIGPWDTTGYTYSQAKVQALPPVLPQLVDVDKDAQDVLAYKGHSEEEEQVRKPEHSGSGGDTVQVLGESQQEVPMSDDTTPAPMTSVSSVPLNPGHFYEDNTLLSDLLPGSGGASSSQAVGGSSTTTKRQEEFGDSERPKVPRVDEPAVPEPKMKAGRTEVRMVHDIEAGISDEIGLEEQWDIAPPDEDYFDDETELQRGEGEGSPQVSDEQLAYLDGEAALEEIKKLHDLKVIEPCSPDPSTIPPEQLVDTIHW